MAINLAAVRTGIKTALAAVDGLNIFDYEAMRPELPAAVVKLPDSIDPRQVFGATHWNYTIPVQLLINGTDAAADAKLEGLIAEDGTSATSLVAALRVDNTFGGACQSSDVVEVTEFGWGEFNDGAIVFLSCKIVIEVMT